MYKSKDITITTKESELENETAKILEYHYMRWYLTANLIMDSEHSREIELYKTISFRLDEKYKLFDEYVKLEKELKEICEFLNSQIHADISSTCVEYSFNFTINYEPI